MDIQIEDNMPQRILMKNKDLPTTKSVESGAQVGAPAPRTKFTNEFKRSAVAKLRESGTNATLLAIELGIRRNQLYKWAKTLDERGPDTDFRSPGRPAASEETEVVRLRRELARAQQELAVLKKFDAYLTRLKK
jgi:transposase